MCIALIDRVVRYIFTYLYVVPCVSFDFLFCLY